MTSRLPDIIGPDDIVATPNQREIRSPAAAEKRNGANTYGLRIFQCFHQSPKSRLTHLRIFVLENSTLSAEVTQCDNAAVIRQVRGDWPSQTPISPEKILGCRQTAPPLIHAPQHPPRVLWLPREGCLLARDPRIDALREHVQRQGA